MRHSPLPRTQRRFRLTFTDGSYKFPHLHIPTLSLSCSRAPPTSSSQLQIQARVHGSAHSHLHHRRQTTSSRTHLRGSIPLEHPCLMTASASSPRLSCNHARIQGNGTSHFPHHLHRKSRSTKPMKANSHLLFPLPTTQKPSRPELKLVPRHLIRYSKLLHLPLPRFPTLSPPLVNGKGEGTSYQIIHHSCQRSSAPHPLLPQLSPLPLPVT